MKQEKTIFYKNPYIRIPTIDSGRLRNRKNNIVGMLEINVDNLRKEQRRLFREGFRFSFTACIIKIVGDCVADYNKIQGSLINDRKIITFTDVDISISLEHELEGDFVPFPLIIRAVNNKTVVDIEEEIDRCKKNGISMERIPFFKKHPVLGRILLMLFYAIPAAVRVFIMEIILKSPRRSKRVIGTVGFANVNMTGRLSGWAFPLKEPYSLYVSMGSIIKKPVIVRNNIEKCNVMNLMIIFDHNIIDGAPAKRFMNKLVKTIEDGKITL